MGAMAWPAPSPGAPLEAEGNLRPREMTVHDGIRLIGLLGIFAQGFAAASQPSYSPPAFSASPSNVSRDNAISSSVTIAMPLMRISQREPSASGLVSTVKPICSMRGAEKGRDLLVRHVEVVPNITWLGQVRAGLAPMPG